jgi:hypothetical protein
MLGKLHSFILTCTYTVEKWDREIVLIREMLREPREENAE